MSILPPEDELRLPIGNFVASNPTLRPSHEGILHESMPKALKYLLSSALRALRFFHDDVYSYIIKSRGIKKRD